MARLFCQRALDIEPTNLSILDMLGNICAELGDVEKAKQISFAHLWLHGVYDLVDVFKHLCLLRALTAVCVFLKALELSPEEGHSKYMYLGQINTGTEAVQYFSKGIELMLNTMDKLSNEARPYLTHYTAHGIANTLLVRKVTCHFSTLNLLNQWLSNIFVFKARFA